MFRIKASLPNGTVNGENHFGKCLLATKSFQKGEIIAVTPYLLVKPFSLSNFEVILEDKLHLCHLNQTFELDRKWALGTYDIYMNHSCDPTTAAIACEKDSYAGMERTLCEVVEFPENFDIQNAQYFYLMVYAVKDIEPGDEISFDCVTFSYDDKPMFDVCLCRSSKCRSVVPLRGFVDLSFDKQLELIPSVPQSVIDQLLEDNNHLSVVDCRLYERDGMITAADYIVAARDYNEGDSIALLPDVHVSSCVQKLIFIFRDRVANVSLDDDSHEEGRNDLQKIWLSLLEGANDPNADVIVESNIIRLIAKKKLSRGDILTSLSRTYPTKWVKSLYLPPPIDCCS